MIIPPDAPPLRAAISDLIKSLDALGYPIIFLHYENSDGHGATITSPLHAAHLSATVSRLAEVAKGMHKVLYSSDHSTDERYN